MKQLPSDKYNVAWFKLAEFVSRGEKERAMGIYRLLAHSLKDKAFVHQLEGDLLLSFNDEGAFERYADSARLYLEQGRGIEAAAVYEHMVALEPKTDQQLHSLLDLYKQCPKEVRVIEATQHLLRWMMEKKEFLKVSFVLQQLDEQLVKGQNPLAVIHQELVQAWLKIDNPPTDPVLVHVKKIIDHYFVAKQQKALQTFLMTLKMLHGMLYEQACGYMQDGDITV